MLVGNCLIQYLLQASERRSNSTAKMNSRNQKKTKTDQDVEQKQHGIERDKIELIAMENIQENSDDIRILPKLIRQITQWSLPGSTKVKDLPNQLKEEGTRTITTTNTITSSTTTTTPRTSTAVPRKGAKKMPNFPKLHSKLFENMKPIDSGPGEKKTKDTAVTKTKNTKTL